MKLLLLSNTQGRLIKTILDNPTFRNHTVGLITSKACGAEEYVGNIDKITYITKSQSNMGISNEILEFCLHHSVDYIFSIGFTKLLAGDILSVYKNKIINSHYSLLPAFIGDFNIKPRDLFDRALLYGSLITGNTVHLIDSTKDLGKPIIQTSFPLNYYSDYIELRHELFIQEVKSILQTFYWIYESRLYINKEGYPRIINAVFTDYAYSPSLDSVELINLILPNGLKN